MSVESERLLRELSSERPRVIASAVALTVFALATSAAVWCVSQPAYRFERARRIAISESPERLDEMEQVGRRLERTRGGKPFGQILLALRQIKLRDFAAAERNLVEATQTPQTKVPALVYLSQMAMQMGKAQIAQQILQECYALEKDRPETVFALASLLHHMGSDESARGAFLFLTTLTPNDPRPHEFLGNFAIQPRRDFAAAAAHFEEALRLYPYRNPPEYNGFICEIGQCFIELGQYDEAMRRLARAEDSPQRAYLEARCHYHQGNLEQAQRQLLRCLAGYPDHFSALLLSGQIALERDDVSLAIQQLQHAARLVPKKYDVQQNLSLALEKAGRREEAAQHADLAEKIRQTEAEIIKLETTASGDMKDVECRLQVAAKHQSLDRFEIAHGWYQNVLSLDPENEQAIAAIKELHQILSGKQVPATEPNAEPKEPATDETGVKEPDQPTSDQPAPKENASDGDASESDVSDSDVPDGAPADGAATDQPDDPPAEPTTEKSKPSVSPPDENSARSKSQPDKAPNDRQGAPAPTP